MKKFFKGVGFYLLLFLFFATTFAAWKTMNWSVYDVIAKRFLFTSDGTQSGASIMDINSGGNIIAYGPLVDGSGNNFITVGALSGVYLTIANSGVYFEANSGTYFNNNITNALSGYITGGALSGYLTGYSETDPIFNNLSGNFIKYPIINNILSNTGRNGNLEGIAVDYYVTIKALDNTILKTVQYMTYSTPYAITLNDSGGNLIMTGIWTTSGYVDYNIPLISGQTYRLYYYRTDFTPRRYIGRGAKYPLTGQSIVYVSNSYSQDYRDIIDNIFTQKVDSIYLTGNIYVNGYQTNIYGITLGNDTSICVGSKAGTIIYSGDNFYGCKLASGWVLLN